MLRCASTRGSHLLTKYRFYGIFLFMLKVAMFEDQSHLIMEQGLLDQLHGHELTAEAATLGGAFDVLKRMVHGDLEIDVVLLDANLHPDREEPIFTHQLPVDESKAKPNWRGKIKTPKPEIAVVRGSAPEYQVPGGDAKAIIDVMQQTGLTAKLIGISGDPMWKYGLEAAMHIDLTKWGIARLGNTLASIEQETANPY
jgi:hypothetical protein